MRPPVSGMCPESGAAHVSGMYMASVRVFLGMDWVWAKALRPARRWKYRRNETQRVWAKRLGISVPTLIRMERGEPGVAIGVYVTALWMIGRAQALVELADPKHDSGALEREVRRALKRRTVRSVA